MHNSEGFWEFSQAIIKIGAKYGALDPKNVLSCRQTVAKSSYDLAASMEESLINFLKTSKVVDNDQYALTSDIWTSKFTLDSYLEIHISYIYQFKINTSVLKMVHFDQKHTAQNIEDELVKCITEIGGNPAKCRITTDCGSNILRTVQSMQNIQCGCHRLNTVIRTSWNKTEIPELVELESSIGKLFSFISKKADLQSKLPVKVKPTSQTRAWRGLIEKLERIQISYDVLESELDRFNKRVLIVSIDKNVLSHCIRLLKPFESIFDKLEKSKSPSIQNLIPSYYLVQEHLNIKEDDPKFIADFKTEISTQLTAKLLPTFTEMHYIGTFLDPSFKNYSFIKNDISRLETIEKSKALVRKFCCQFKREIVEPLLVEPPKPKYSNNLFDMIDSPNLAKDEVQSYINHRNHRLENPLDFWKRNASEYPELSTLAQQIYCCQASSSLSERIFSYGGKINNPGRSSLKPKHLCHLIKLASFFQNL